MNCALGNIKLSSRHMVVETARGVINYLQVSMANYIIDGHNLIAKIPGLSLSMPDDEHRLIELLNRYGQESRHQLEVYFDGAPPGQAGVHNYGRVRAYFVPESQSADETIRRRLRRLGRSATNWVVVTSDRVVQSAAREAHAKVLRAEDFSRLMHTALQARLASEHDDSDQPLSGDEVSEWLAIFKAGRK